MRVFALAIVCAALVTAACDRGHELAGDEEARAASREAAGATAAAGPAGGLVKIVLQPEGMPDTEPIELLLEIDPPVAGDGWVGSLASEVNEGLQACAEAGHSPEIDVVLEVEGSAVTGGEGGGELAGCFIAELSGAQLTQLDDEPRRLRLRIGDHVP